ncbi:uncharacterized protein VTP21DRAFT_9861 [Calcarisporiella thermophila]|uniref:uncharacterized protein n=1 Tax=Calcarisporiella thermophila TaxID=911321 RepID=UPI0037446B2B
MMSNDPFFTVKSEVEQSLSNAITLFESWNRIFQMSSSDSEELKGSAEDLMVQLGSIESDLADLEDTIKVVEENPEKFNLSFQEIDSRRYFIDRVRKQVEDMKYTLNNPSRRSRQDKSTGSGSRQRDTKKSEAFQEYVSSNQRFIENEQQHQMVLMQEQDEELEHVSGTVGRLRHMALDMGDELELQHGILSELDDTVSKTQDKLKGALRRVKDFLKRNEDSKSSYCICFLIIILIILLFLVIIM